MPREASPTARSVSRRSLLSAAAAVGGAAAAGPLLSACGTSKSSGPGTTSQTQLSQVVPAYVANTSIKPDGPSVQGTSGAASDPLFLKYPDSPAQTVSGTPGKGGTYTAMTPLWGSIPPSSGNGYYDAVNKALGTTIKMQPSDGNTYNTVLPPLFAGSKVPDILMIPGYLNVPLKVGEAVGRYFTDLTPYLAGDKAKDYPNLANIPTGAWAAGVWNSKLYGLPCYPSAASFEGATFFRKDIFDKQGINPDNIKTVDDLFNLGKELTNAKAGVWAFDAVMGNDAAYFDQVFHYPQRWADVNGKLVFKYETDEMIEALNWHAKLAKAGYIHPDALANNSQNADQRFFSGKVLVSSGGTGAWNGSDTKSGTAANPNYRRQAFKLLTSNASKPPSIPLQPGAGFFAYLNAKLSDKQVKELLSVLNYIAAPYGSKEWLTVNYGAEGVDYTMQGGNPVLTEQGNKEVATTYQFLVTPQAVTTVQQGYVDVAQSYAAWQADAVKYAYKPVFFAMNITEPAQYASIAKPVTDTIDDVKLGRKPISAFQDAVKTWRSSGGDQLRTFYDGIRSKYGDGTK
jgi:putative aldouronate transport system substrate-binding protein